GAGSPPGPPAAGGGRKTRVIVMPPATPARALQTGVEPVEPLLPELLVAAEPVDGVQERPRREPGGPELRLPAARHEPRALQHLQMVGDGLHGDRERLRKLVHGGVALREPREDRPPGRGGERGKGGRELVGGGRNQLIVLASICLIMVPEVSAGDRLEDQMGTIVVTEFVSIDGVMEDPGGGEGYERGGWAFEVE